MAATNMNIRMDSEIKAQAQVIFSQFGLDMTTAVNMFLRQTIRERGIPFSLKLEDQPTADELTAHWTPEQWNAVSKMLEKSEKQFENGEFRDAFDVLKEAKAKHGL